VSDSGSDSGPEAGKNASDPNSSSLDRKYGIALVLYAVLAVAAWFTVGEGSVVVLGRLVQIRWIPVFVLAMFAFRTVMAMQADRIRRGGK
jgi:hypothetical protein